MEEEFAVHDAKVAVLAAAQHSVVAFWQLIELGLSRGAIHHRVLTKRLHRVHHGVYAVGHPALTPEGRDMAAVLACGPHTVLGRWSASARWELLRPTGGPVTVITPRRCALKGIEAQTVKTLHPHDRTKRHGIPITTVPRTLLDLAAVADERILRRAVNQAERTRRLNRRAIDELLERHPRTKGRNALVAVIASVIPAARRSRSDLELAFLDLCRRYGIETPVMNGKVMGIEVDFHWPGTNLIVEIDHYEYHRTPQEFENDRRRDAHLKRHGYEVLRIPDAWLDTDPAGVAETVKSLLGSPD